MTDTKSKPNIYIFSGAGLSAPSGIPTFRSKGGLWTEYDVDEVCNYRTWKMNRDKVFEFFKKLETKYNKAKPNKAHQTIADLQKKYGTDRVKVFTQNVDRY